MPTQPRNAFLWVRRLADLEGDSAGVTAYLRNVRRNPHTNDRDLLQGIWVDEAGVATWPGALVLPDADGGRRTTSVTEATGVPGVWMLYLLEDTAGCVFRDDLVAALLECFGHDRETAPRSAHFVPVFACDASDSSVTAELQRLESRYPELVLAPMCDDGSGNLLGPSADPQQGRGYEPIRTDT